MDLHSKDRQVTKCIHGLPVGSCGTCKRNLASSRRMALAEVLFFLNDQKTRATYSAVAECIGVIPQAMGERLGDRTPEASWVVNADDGRPTGYLDSEMHPELFRSPTVITSADELRKRVIDWRKREK